MHGVAFTPDGKGIVSGGADKIVRLSDAVTGEEIRRFVGHTAVIWPVAVSADGRYVLSAGGLRNRTPVFYEPAGFDSEVRLWDMATGEELHRYEGHTGCLIMGLRRPDGRVVSGMSDQTMRVWEMKLPGGPRQKVMVASTQGLTAATKITCGHPWCRSPCERHRVFL